jgi:hypothetical protein
MDEDRANVERTAWTRMNESDLKRISMLLLAATELSTGGYVLLRRATRPEAEDATERAGHWRVNVRLDTMEHTSRAKILARPGANPQKWQALCLALDRSVQWLRAAKARNTLGPEDLRDRPKNP